MISNRIFLSLFVLLLSCSKQDEGPKTKFKLNDFEFPGTDENKNGVSDEVEKIIQKSIKHETLQTACFNYIQSEYELLSRDDVGKSRDVFIENDRRLNCLSFLSSMIDERASTTCFTTVKDKMFSGSKELGLRNRLIQNQLLFKYDSIMIRGETVWDKAKYCDFYIPNFEKRLHKYFKLDRGDISDENRSKLRSAIEHNNKYRPSSH